MNKTIYKNIKEGSKAYKKIMDRVGACLAGGGYVEFTHNLISHGETICEWSGKQQISKFTNYCDVTLHHP